MKKIISRCLHLGEKIILQRYSLTFETTDI